MKGNRRDMDTAEKRSHASTSLSVTACLAFLILLPVEMQLSNEELLSPTLVLGQSLHGRGDFTRGLNYWLPQFVRRAQLWEEKVRSGSQLVWV